MKIEYIHPLVIVILHLTLSSCDQKRPAETSLTSGSAIELKYATGFSIIPHEDYTLVEVIRPFQGATEGYTYLLVPKGKEIPKHSGSYRVVRTPVESIVCTSTTHIPLLDYLDLTEKLVGFPTTDYISSEKTRQRIDNGHVKDLGVDKGLNFEQLVMLKPDIVMGYTMSADYGQFKKIEEFGIPVILNAEYLEMHPLGRAEWIKFVAAFFDKAELADSVFNTIEETYLKGKTIAANTTDRPKVLSGIMYGDAWFLPGGKNYGATLLADAGCQYLWADNPSQGYLELSFESVYEKASDADIWIGVGPFTTMDELRAGDHRYEKLKPFKTKRVYSYDARKGAKGGNEYLELGYLRPDLILLDLIHIAHPDIMEEHELYFHRKLK